MTQNIITFLELNQNKFDDLLSTFGIDHETDMCIEEMTELIKSLLKIRRFGYNDETRKSLEEEFTDVTITLYQIYKMYNINEESIIENIHKKLDFRKILKEK